MLGSLSRDDFVILVCAGPGSAFFNILIKSCFGLGFVILATYQLVGGRTPPHTGNRVDFKLIYE